MLQGSCHEKGFENRFLVLLRDVLKVVKEAQIWELFLRDFYGIAEILLVMVNTQVKVSADSSINTLWCANPKTRFWLLFIFLRSRDIYLPIFFCFVDL